MPVRVRYQKLRKVTSALMKQRTGRERTLTNNQVKFIIGQVTVALKPNDRVKLMDLVRAAAEQQAETRKLVLQAATANAM